MASYMESQDREEQEPFIPAYGRGFSGVEEDQEAEEFLNGPRGGRFRNLSVAVNIMLVCVGVALCVLVGVLVVSPVPQSLGKKPKVCEALMLLVRHAEKEKDAKEPGGSPHISKVGEKRAALTFTGADYLGHCMQHRSPALPWGKPSVLMAVTNQSSGSVRPYETLLPLAGHLGEDILTIQDDDYEGLMDAVDKHVGCGQTVLVEAVMPSNFWMYDKWPEECPSENFVEPNWLPGSKCYDIILSMPLRERTSAAGEKRWWPGWMDVYHEGFGGKPDSECAEDLSPLIEDAASEDAADKAALEELHAGMLRAEEEVEKKAAAQQPAQKIKVDVILE